MEIFTVLNSTISDQQILLSYISIIYQVFSCYANYSCLVRNSMKVTNYNKRHMQKDGRYLRKNVVYIYPTPPPQEEYNTRSIFKWSTVGLNSEFSFSLTGCLTKVKEFGIPYYWPKAGGRADGFMPFPRMRWNAISLIQGLNSNSWFPSITTKMRRIVKKMWIILKYISIFQSAWKFGMFYISSSLDWIRNL